MPCAPWVFIEFEDEFDADGDGLEDELADGVGEEEDELLE
jgi:hypothetical protein